MASDGSSPAASTTDFDHMIKMVVVGDAFVGKSALLVQYTENKFDQNVGPTISVDVKISVLVSGGRTCKVAIWDTAGQDRFRAVTATFYRNTQAVLLVFDLTDGRTLDALERWLDEIREHLPEGGGSLGRDVEVILVGNKADKVEDREVSADAAKAWGKAHGVTTYVETSAKTNMNVQEAFEAAVAKVLANPILREKTSVAYKHDMRAPRPGLVSMPAMQPVVASKGCCS